jgi:hypothetical protein
MERTMSETFSVLSVRAAVRRTLRQLSAHDRAGLSFLFRNAREKDYGI